MDIKKLKEKKSWKQLITQVKQSPAGRKAEDTLSHMKLQRRIRDLEEEIALQMQTLGEMIYDTHRGTPSTSTEMQLVLEYVDSLYEEIEAHRRQIRMMQGFRFCAACGAENAEANAFCQDCGKSLTEEA